VCVRNTRGIVDTGGGRVLHILNAEKILSVKTTYTKMIPCRTRKGGGDRTVEIL